MTYNEGFNEYIPHSLYEYRHLRNNECYWEKRRYCFTCGELSLKHYKKLLKERDKWICDTHGIIRQQSALPDEMTYHGWRDSGQGELDNDGEDKRNFNRTRWGEINESPDDKYNYRELNDMFCKENNYTESDFSICSNGCDVPVVELIESCTCYNLYRHQYTLSFKTKKSMEDYKNYPNGVNYKIESSINTENIDDSIWNKFN